jgi:Ca-activated chloride channel family protein
MRFGDPQAFWLLLLVPLLTLFLLRSFRSRRRALSAFGSPQLIRKLTSATSRVRQGIKSGLVVSGVLFLVLALVRPQLGTQLELVRRRGVDIFIALDTSRSMLAEDILPSRLTRARYEISDLIDRLEGDRVGIVAFAGRSFVVCPLTLDYGAAKLFLETVDTDLISAQGTALEEAIRTAAEAFGSEERKYKVLVLITDGEGHTGDPIEAAEEAAESGVRIYTVGLGTPEGELIPILVDGRTEFLKDREGNIVKTRLDEATLQEVARVSDGAYYRASFGGVGLEQVYDAIAGLEEKDLGSRQYTQYIHRFQWPLAFALLCFVCEALLSDRRRTADSWTGRFQ